MSEPSYGEPDGFSVPPGIEFVQDNGGPSLTEPTLDFEDSPSLVWSVVDDPLNQRIKVRAATTSDLLDLSVAATVAGKIEVTSTNPDLPTGIVDSSTLTFDGTQKVQIIFAAAGIDIDQRGIANPGAVLLELYDNGVAAGLIFDFNASGGSYAETGCYIGAILTPTAGDHTFSIKAYKQGSGGTGAGSSFVYGANLATPHATRPAYIAVASFSAPAAAGPTVVDGGSA
jgi:hypothetical protein